MKGGRTAPRKHNDEGQDRSADQTSMKGGRTAPRKYLFFFDRAKREMHFNEGGADCPPKAAEPESYEYRRWLLQ